MRPLQVGLRAFGPFLEPNSIDFRLFRSSSLFLIHGPVGAGKTSILDAICFALYGTSSGGERRALDLRCDLADEKVPTEVTLDFQHGASTYRVRRRIVKDQLEAALWNLTGMDVPKIFSPPPLPPLEQNVGWQATIDVVEEILGLNDSEFRRSVMIPQGQFRQFLCCSPDDRAGILQTLFQVQAGREVEGPLSGGIERRTLELNQYWKKREELSGESPSGEGGASRLERMADYRRKVAEIEQEQERLSAAQGKVVEMVSQAALVEERSLELDSAKRQLEHVEQRHKELDSNRHKAERFRSAQTLVPYQEQLELARHDRDRCLSELEQARQEQQGQVHGLDQVKGLREIQELKDLQADLRQELKALESSEELFQKLESLQTNLSGQRQLAQQISQELQELVLLEHKTISRLEEIGKSEEFNATRDRIQLVRALLSAHQGGQKRTRQRAELEQNLQRLRQYRDRAQSRCQEIQERLTNLREEVEQVQSASWSEQACRLAQMLQPGQPCVVCGSLEHPQPASRTPEPVVEGELERRSTLVLSGRNREPSQAGQNRKLEQKQSQLKQTEILLQKLNREREEQALMVARLESKLDSLSEDQHASGPAPTPAEMAELQEELRRLERASHQRASVDQERARLEQTLHRLQKNRVELERNQREVDAQIIKLETLLEEKRHSLREGFSTQEGLVKARKHITDDLLEVENDLRQSEQSVAVATSEQAARAAAVMAMERSLQLAEERLKLASEILETRSNSAGFASAEEVEQATLATIEESIEFEHDLKSVELELSAAQDRVHRAQTSYDSGVEHFGLHHTPDELKTRLETLVQQRMDTLVEMDELHRQEKEYQSCIQSIQELEEEIAALKKLLRIAQGDNGLGLSFVDYTLSERMQNVLFAANRRLAPMTRGRFQLQLVKNKLELEVRDEWVGQIRPIATLSGGETFLASLALAVGLSDIQPTGSPRHALDTLFIDEGFGNLDEDALELALEGLLQLRQEGRLVGVVSHLAQLQSEIPARIEVFSSPLGSRLELALPA